MYFFESGVRSSETDETEKLKISGIVDYFQDCATFQAASLGVGTDYLHALGIGWVLSTWNIEIYRRPSFGEEIVSGTAPYEVKGFFGKRNFRLSTKDGEVLAVADSLWTMLDLTEGKAVRVPQEVIDGYELDEKLPMNYLRSRIVIPKELSGREPVTAGRHLIDSNGHVNNGRYVELAFDAVRPEEYRRLRVEYHRQAREGDRICPLVGENESGTVVVLADENGEKYCVTEWGMQ